MVLLIDCNFAEFINRTQKKRIIAFGAGRKFVPFVERNGLIEKISCVIDCNAENLQKEISFEGGYAVPVHSMDFLVANNDAINGTAFLITSVLSAGDILKELDSIQAFEGVDCFICSLLEEHTSCRTIDFKKGNALIPKVIHYAWFGHNRIPDRFEENIATWRKYCPDYEIIRWDESNYDISKNRYMKEAYEEEKWGFVPDYLRLDVIYEFGGIYFDTDVEVIQNLDDLLGSNSFMGYFDASVVALGLGFGATKGNKLIKILRDYYNDCHFRNEDGSYNMTTCVEYQYGVLKDYGFTMNGEYENINGNIIFPMDVFNPMGKSGAHVRITENTHSIHKAELSYESLKVRDEYFRSLEYIKKRLN